MKITIDIDPNQPGNADLLRHLADALEGQQTRPADAPTIRPIRIDPIPAVMPDDYPGIDTWRTGRHWIDPTKLPIRPYIWLGSPAEGGSNLICEPRS